MQNKWYIDDIRYTLMWILILTNALNKFKQLFAVCREANYLNNGRTQEVTIDDIQISKYPSRFYEFAFMAALVLVLKRENGIAGDSKWININNLQRLVIY